MRAGTNVVPGEFKIFYYNSPSDPTDPKAEREASELSGERSNGYRLQ